MGLTQTAKAFLALLHNQVFGLEHITDAILDTAMYARKATERVTLKRPNSVRFNTRHIRDVTPEEVYQAINKELDSVETIKCIASLENSWYNVTFDNEKHCERIALQGMFLKGILIQCERTNIQNSVVVYVKAPFEMGDDVIVNALNPYGTVTNVRRQYHDFDKNVETGVRSVLIKNLKQLIPSYVRVGGFNIPVRHRGQQKTCKICNKPGHFARDCPMRGRCFVCGNPEHRAEWHEMQKGNSSGTSTPVAHEDRNIDEMESEISEDERERIGETDGDDSDVEEREQWERTKDMVSATEPAPSDNEEGEEDEDEDEEDEETNEQPEPPKVDKIKVTEPTKEPNKRREKQSKHKETTHDKQTGDKPENPKGDQQGTQTGDKHKHKQPADKQKHVEKQGKKSSREKNTQMNNRTRPNNLHSGTKPSRKTENEKQMMKKILTQLKREN